MLKRVNGSISNNYCYCSKEEEGKQTNHTIQLVFVVSLADRVSDRCEGWSVHGAVVVVVVVGLDDACNVLSFMIWCRP